MFPDLIQTSVDLRTCASAIGYGLPLLAEHLHSTLACPRAECLQKTSEWPGTRSIRRLGSWLPAAISFGPAAPSASWPHTFRCAACVRACQSVPPYRRYAMQSRCCPSALRLG